MVENRLNEEETQVREPDERGPAVRFFARRESDVALEVGRLPRLRGFAGGGLLDAGGCIVCVPIVHFVGSRSLRRVAVSCFRYLSTVLFSTCGSMAAWRAWQRALAVSHTTT